ncbi:hypothetical protein J416_11397 [Gracilibacillus halophilus YIM-C55.5]|uniref:DUF421 domain-containing protein n=1 Tax=Gracilibacillus halophilus YIM-C55.5 TaxID=1308866 RepID=N4WAN4_9BACI|nr:DUF421 domain-containing protein [Gracilibacillus halophilus]ENH96329.1 hypothetical protein J416_11397 [Gracilibacillus halophilus YIM-C55.5]
MTFFELLIRTACAFLGLFILTRILGRKEISQMTFFNFVSAIAIGSITANFVVNQNLSIRNGLFALLAWTIFTLIMDGMDIKSKALRKVVTGDPIVIIKEGKLIEESLKNSRLDIDSLNAMMRQKNYFSIADIEYAIFETDGKLSVLPKESKQPATKNDVNSTLVPKVYPIPTEVITDGKLLHNNLAKLNLNEKWVKQEIQNSNQNLDIQDILFAQVQTDGSLYVLPKNT